MKKAKKQNNNNNKTQRQLSSSGDEERKEGMTIYNVHKELSCKNMHAQRPWVVEKKHKILFAFIFLKTNVITIKSEFFFELNYE